MRCTCFAGVTATSPTENMSAAVLHALPRRTCATIILSSKPQAQTLPPRIPAQLHTTTVYITAYLWSGPSKRVSLLLGEVGAVGAQRPGEADVRKLCGAVMTQQHVRCSQSRARIRTGRPIQWLLVYLAQREVTAHKYSEASWAWWFALQVKEEWVKVLSCLSKQQALWTAFLLQPDERASVTRQQAHALARPTNGELVVQNTADWLAI